MDQPIFKGKRIDTGLPSVVSQPRTRARQTISNLSIAEMRELGRSRKGRKILARIIHAVKKRRAKALAARRKKLADLRENEAAYIRGGTNLLKSF